MDSNSKNYNFIRLVWTSTICWYLLTGHQWTDLIVKGNFKLIYIIEAFLFTTCLAFFLSFSDIIFKITLALQILEWFFLLPFAPNHRWVFTFATFVLLFEKQNLSKALGIIAACVYFFAGFVKVNPDFLFTSHSCCAKFFSHALLGFHNPEIEILLPALVTFTELALVLLILIPKTRILAVFISLSLHLGLALDLLKHFLDFSSVMSCIMITQILPNNLSIFEDTSLKKIGKFLVFSLFFLIVLRSNAFYIIDNPTFSIILEVFWLFYYSFIIYAFYLISINEFSNWKIFDFQKLSVASYLIIFILILNGMSPYLGLKTRSSFSMYSNLWIDDSGSNHFIIKKSLDIFDFLKDDVKILDTNDLGDLKLIQNKKMTLPYLQLYNIIKSEPLLKVRFLRAGNIISYPEQSLPTPNPLFDNWLARKFLVFQSSSPEIKNECIW